MCAGVFAGTPNTPEEVERRRRVARDGLTDYARWADVEQLEPAWAARAQRAAQYVPAGATVLDLGCGAMDLERALPPECQYRPCDLVARDRRTIVCDFNRGEFPETDGVEAITLLGVLEYVKEPLELLRRVRCAGVPVVCSYSVTDRRPEFDRAGQGWVNSLSSADFHSLVREAGFAIQHREQIDPLQDLFKLIPCPGSEPLSSAKRVLVLSYYNDPNFGDRLGYHLVNALIPPAAVIVHAAVKPWTVPQGPFDLLVLGIGNSLNAATVQRPELHALLERVPHTIGIFGTQYRYQYGELIDPTLMGKLLDRLTMWWARSEEDLLAFGRGRSNVRYLGDWLVTAFPNAVPSLNRTLEVPADIKSRNLPLDRIIQQIQSYRRVFSMRIHPLLCALPSAEAVAYREQHEDPRQRTSGKFRSLLMDVFGRVYPEEKFFEVDRDAVRAYKVRVEKNVQALKQEVQNLLAS